MELINAGPAHIPEIQDITEATWPSAYGAILTAGQIRYMIGLFYSPEVLERQMAAGHRFLLLRDEERSIGFAGFEPDHEAPATAKLHKLYLRPSAQGAGGGGFLLDAVKSAVRNEGQDRLLLNVNRFNKARRFYEKHGFRVIREEDIDIGNGYFMNDYVMEWRPQ